MMESPARLSFPQFGGDGIGLIVSDQAVAVDGTVFVSVRIPVNAEGFFSNAKCDRPDRQVVLETHQPDTHHLELRIALTSREGEDAHRSELRVSPSLHEAMVVLMEVKNGTLNVKVEGPWKERGPSKTLTVRVPPVLPVGETVAAS